MKRRDILKLATIAGLGSSFGRSATADAEGQVGIERLPVPSGGTISVAFVLGRGAEVVDFAGPWGVFEYVRVTGREGSPFTNFTVAQSTRPLKVSGGMKLLPDHSFANAPPPRIIVVPAMEDESAAMLSWLKRTAPTTDLTMSVCNGAFLLAKAGLLAGKTATAHHNAYGALQSEFPNVTVRRGARFVDAGKISTAGGLTSGIDLALHVVERFFGRGTAEQTATFLEYQGQGWKDPDANSAFARRPMSTPERPICPVCEMAVDPNAKLTGSHRGRTVLFCSSGCKRAFDKSPDRFFGRSWSAPSTRSSFRACQRLAQGRLRQSAAFARRSAHVRIRLP